MINSVAEKNIKKILSNTRYEHEVYEGKCLITKAVLPCGFIIVTSSGCVDPRNFSVEIGRKTNMDFIEQKVWEMEGYKLTCDIHDILLNEKGNVDDLSTLG